MLARTECLSGYVIKIIFNIAFMLGVSYLYFYVCLKVKAT